MKKILFASTALVAASVMGAGSASASEKINLQLGGFSKWWVVGAWQSTNFQNGPSSSNAGAVSGPASYNNVNVKGDNEVWFGGNTTLDNGLKVGVDIHLEAGGHTDMTTDTIDKSYVYVEGGFGKFLVGTNNNGTYLLHVAAPDAAGNSGEGGIMTGNYTIVRPTSVNGMAGGNTTASATASKAEAITYVAPTFYGLTVGASYLPHASYEDVRSQVNLNGTTLVGTSLQGGIQEAYGAGALYANTFGGVGVKVSAGAIQAKLGGGLSGDVIEQSYGTQLSYAGFTIGGSFRDINRNMDPQQGAATDVAALGNISFGNAAGSYGSGQAWDAGIQYATGPYAVSFNYFRSAVAHSDFARNERDHTTFYQVSGKYSLGAGVDMLASAGYAQYTSTLSQTATQSAQSIDPNNNSGWTVMSGLSLAF